MNEATTKRKRARLPSFINRKRYVFVKDLKLGQCGSYTDYEELAFTDTTNDAYERLQQVVANMAYRPDTYRYDSWTDEQYEQEVKKVQQHSRNICDLVFYSTSHILSAFMEWKGVAPTEQEMSLMVEGALHMVETVLPCNWVIRADVDWSSIYTPPAPPVSGFYGLPDEPDQPNDDLIDPYTGEPE